MKMNFKLFIYGMFSNWGLVVLANILGLFFINVIGIDLVKQFTPFLYALLSIGLYFPQPNSRDFRLGYIVAFLIGLGFLFKFYYPLFIGV
ncbi:MAG: hypothetical protein KJ905_01910 [Nanoarchaeota archaeon]|nr:hypothetical protein [Nanoarchaeota archaeon]MBU1501509.1 hypothetical protein [Nanoarchaeota archaeon]MBU2459037.1 hypothetical protein [Nanoarchaeota archaeon]